MAIRDATEDDLRPVLPLLRAYCDFYEAKPSDEGLEAMARAVMAAPEDQAFLLVAEDDPGEIVGFAACAWKWSSLRGARIVVLDDLYVDPAARGQGFADSLIAATAEIAGRYGAPVVTWLTAPDNRRAQAVYDRVGGKAETFLEYELELDS
jgi:ribosomal protein S18 acetylase RimI-like enzyme